MPIVKACCSLAGDNPCGRILNGSIVLNASCMELRYTKNVKTGSFEIHAHASRFEYPGPAISEPLKLDFSPETPLDCQPDGSLARSA